MSKYLTAHAILRYLERVEGVDIGVIRDGAIRAGAVNPDQRQIWQFARDYMGFDEEAIEARFLTPTVRAAIKAGAKKIRVKGAIFIVRDNAITTAISSSYDRIGKKVTKRQGRREKSWKMRALEEANS
jgi:hypothetical protein